MASCNELWARLQPLIYNPLTYVETYWLIAEMVDMEAAVSALKAEQERLERTRRDAIIARGYLRRMLYRWN